MELGVEYLVGNAAGLEQLADHLGFFDGGGADQDGLAAAVTLGDDIQDGGVLAKDTDNGGVKEDDLRRAFELSKIIYG